MKEKEERPSFELLAALQNEAIAAGLLAIRERLENIEFLMAKFEEELKASKQQ